MTDFFEDMNDKAIKDSIIKNVSSLPSNYVGSKRRLLSHIWNVLESNDVKFDSVFDAFSGSGLVSLMFKHMGKEVICNDLLTSSAITAICLLENNTLPIDKSSIDYLCNNEPKDYGTFVLDNYKNKFFTENECIFLDKYKANISELYGEKFYCGMELLKQATLASIPNSNFSVYGKNLKSLRSTHEIGKSFWDEKWRDTTRKRRDVNNEIMFQKSIHEMYGKYQGAFSLFAIENHVNKYCFLGGRYYNGQTLANLEHRLKHDKVKGQELQDINLSIEPFKKALIDGSSCVFNSDIISLLESDIIQTDLLYLDPPYGGSSSDYSNLYRFLEEYLYDDKLENLDHIRQGSKRFSKSKGYQDQFELLLGLCGNFKNWLISYNESSFSSIDNIVSIIKNAGKSNVQLFEIPITYQYRKDKSLISKKDFIENFDDSGEKQYLGRGTEYLILARD